MSRTLTRFVPISLVVLLFLVGLTLGCPSDWPVEDDDSAADDDTADDDTADDDSAGDDDAADDDSAGDDDTGDSGSGG